MEIKKPEIWKDPVWRLVVSLAVPAVLVPCIIFAQKPLVDLLHRHLNTTAGLAFSYALFWINVLIGFSWGFDTCVEAIHDIRERCSARTLR